MDTFTTLWNRLLLRAPGVGANLAQDLIKDSFNQLVERRDWSWRQKHSNFYTGFYYATGTVSVTPNSYYVTGDSSTLFTPQMIGKQIRIGSDSASNYPTYTIAQYLSPQSVSLDQPWAGPSLSGIGFQVFQCYFPMPSDFQAFYSLISTTNNYQLQTNVTQFDLDRADPQRVQSGITYCAAFYDYTQSYQGSIFPVLQVTGTGPSPVSTTEQGYSFPAPSTFVIQITSGGTVGISQYQWKQDNGGWVTGNQTSLAAQDLSNGVQVYFPDNGPYITGDTFIINCVAQSVEGVPRYELWPRPINVAYAYPYLYYAKLPALSDDNPALPPFVAQRGDVILEMSLIKAAQFPGSSEQRNPYYDLGLSQQHRVYAEYLINQLETVDDELAIKNLTYRNYPIASAPWLDGAWQQSHAIYP